MSHGTRLALQDLPLKYYATRDHVYLLDRERRIGSVGIPHFPQNRCVRSQSMTWKARPERANISSGK